ncbi:MAG: exonuclease SbcCD subunit D C-terminal domain-containing protein, partial [Clostridia bacterium]|nr:exonuclease SbcCD subunit D C-terminal domain-containing protein [Clostridia bacterium]
NIYLLPFIKPATVRRFFEGEKIESYNDALKAAVDAMKIDTGARNVLIAHQFVTGSSHSGSEEFVVGDLGNVDAEIFAPFDYTALGHVHGAQNVGCERVRYSGTPLKYSLSEAKSEKSVTIVELKAKGDITVRTAALKPLRDVVEIRGTYEELTKKSFYEGTTLTKDLVHVVLTDEDDVPDALAKLRLIYPYIMNVRYDNTRTQNSSQAGELEAVPARLPMELFSALFEAQNNKPMSSEQSELVSSLIEKIWGDER